MSVSLLLAGPVPRNVRVNEVGPRDGLQNEPATISVEAKVALINDLAEAGLRSIEGGSFVSAKWVPQMAGSGDVLKLIHRPPGVSFPVLVPNAKGLDAALHSGVREIAIFTAASETFSHRNTNASIDESLTTLATVAASAQAAGLKVRGYVSCVWGCPYEGPIKTEAVVRVAARLAEMGCYEVSLGDTIGVATPLRAQTLIQAVAARVPIDKLAVHFHDTYGQALANILAALALGVASVDASVAGLGGCPYAPGAGGNVATEDLVYMLDGMGIETGVDGRKVALAGRAICRVLGKTPASKAAMAILSGNSH